jgi:ABC-2 type transport system ATP-binding protein
MPAITVDNLSKTYRYHRKVPGLRGSIAGLLRRQMLETQAVADVSFQIEAGEIVGFLGPNGAGKTTTLKMLCGLLYPSGGQARVLNHTPARREPAFLRQISLVMGQKSMLSWDLPAIETLLLHKEMYSISETDFQRNVRQLAEILEVTELLRVQVRKLSLGERMKMELLTALIHRPALLFLDEPTIGLDVVSQQRVREFLRDVNREQGTTILLTSHYMDDIEELCPRVLVIDHGRLHFDGALASLVERAAPYKLLSAVFAEPVPPAALAIALGELEPRPTDPSTSLRAGDPLRISLAVPRDQVADVASRVLRLGRVVDLSVEEVPVEEIIREMFRAPGSIGERS